MDVLTDDHEREEAVRKWWHEYWKPIALGVTIALAGLLGYRQYQAYVLEQNQAQALEVYKLQTTLQKQGVAALPAAKAFTAENDNVFGAVLSLDMAVAQIEARDYAGAAESVEFARKNGGELIAPSAALTQARLLAESGKPDEAIKVLDTLKNGAYSGEAWERQGDIEISRDNRSAAREAYMAAIKDYQDKKLDVPALLKIKFDNVIAAGDKPAFEIASQPALSAAGK